MLKLKLIDLVKMYIVIKRSVKHEALINESDPFEKYLIF